MESELTRILARLVGINSVSIRPNAPIVALIESEFTNRGWHLERLPYRRQGEERINLLAVSSADKSPELALVGHTDTVTWDASWDEATTLVRRDGQLIGRGTCDMKGFLACMIALGRSLEPARLRRPLAFIFTADEEIGCLGAKQLVEQQNIHPRRAIVGEPTSLRPVRAGKGYCVAEVTVRGREAHSAFPHEGRSAIVQAARLIAEIDRLAQEQVRHTNPFFDPPFTSVNIGLVQGGTAKNIIPGECRFIVEWRPIAGEAPQAFADRLSGLLDEMRRTGLVPEATLEVQRCEAPFETAFDKDLVQFLERCSGAPSTSIAYGTEAPQMARLGAETVVWGPGDMRVAHRTGEHVALAELVRCIEILQATVAEFCL